MTAGLHLAQEWWPAEGAEPPRWVLTLENRGDTALEGFTLCWTGHCKLDPAHPLENAQLLRRVSNFTEVAMPGGALAARAAWRFTVRAINVPLRHWSEAAQAAYLVLADGTTADVTVELCRPGGTAPGTPVLGLAQAEGGRLDDGLALVPWPHHVVAEGATTPPPGLSVNPEGDFAALCALLFPGEQLVDPAGIPVALESADLPEEAYHLHFAGGQARIAAGGPSGHLYGQIALAQLLRAARADPASCRFPARLTIEDAPEHGWRGTHLDVARQYYPPDELARFIATLAWNRINRFHLHLTDDEAWRFELPAYPELTARGAWRGHGLAIPPLLGSGAARHGGAYSRAELAALVALAGRFGITVVPEIDVPGHCFAALAALPWLRDPGETGEYWSIQAFPNNSLNPAVPAMLPFVEAAFGELLDIFPGKWVHVGADEVPHDAWTTSPLATGRAAPALQAGVLRHLHAMLRAAGRVTTAWEEGSLGGGITPEAALLIAWQSPASAPPLAAAGYDVVVAPAQHYYLNMALDPGWWEPGASWAGWSSIAATYQFDPAALFTSGATGRLAGVQCCIWSEQLHDRRVFRRLVFPRLSAVAETGWTAPARKDWRRFAAASRFMPVPGAAL